MKVNQDQRYFPSDDWSGYFTLAHQSLQKAEEELRLIHTNPKHYGLAHAEILKAIRILSQAASWCLHNIE